MLHRLDHSLRLHHKVVQLGLCAGSIHIVMKLNFQILWQLVAKGELWKENLKDLLFPDDLDGARVLLEESNSQLKLLLLLSLLFLLLHFLLFSLLLIRLHGLSHSIFQLIQSAQACRQHLPS